MKIFNWIQTHKYPIVVSLFFTVAIIAIVIFIQGLKKDHSLDLYKIKIEAKEAARQEYIQQRERLEVELKEKDRVIMSLQLRDSLLATRADEAANKILTISKPQYVKEKLQAVDNFTDADLRQYFIDLPHQPQPNDY